MSTETYDESVDSKGAADRKSEIEDKGASPAPGDEQKADRWHFSLL